MPSPPFPAPRDRHLSLPLWSEISPYHYQGSLPPAGKLLESRGFGLLILAAIEHQLPGADFGAVEVLRVPLDDDYVTPLTPREVQMVRGAVMIASRRIAEKRRVLVTCAQGRNRSGLISALMLMRYRSMNPREAIMTVQAARHTALQNPQFIKAVLETKRADLY